MPRMQSERPTSRVPLALQFRRGLLIAIAALGCGGLLSACGSSKGSTETSGGGAKANVNTTKVAASIEQTILEKRHLHSTVVCPAAMPAEVGRTFECIATITSAKAPHATTKTPFVVTIQSPRGYVTYVGK
jgi:hypothetical protein